MELKKEEIESLEYYTSRRSHKYLDSDMINEFLKFLSNPQDLQFGGSNWLYVDYTKIKEILNSIENLYCLCSKYGRTHNLPKNFYRQEHDYSDILDHINKTSNIWVAESFLSFTKSKDDVERFKFNESATLLTAYTDDESHLQRIPFVEVADVLGEEPYSEDESEILIPPFTQIQFDANGSSNIKILSSNSTNIDDYNQEAYEEELERFIELYKSDNDTELNDSRKHLATSFSKKLLK